MTTDEMCEIMKASSEGKSIEVRHKNDTDTDWTDITFPCWNWVDYEYRVKPEAAEPRYSIDDVTGELKAKIKSLRAERHEMASAVSNAVWKELMDRAKNIEGPVNTSMVGFGFNDISDVVLNKILDYKPEDKPVKKVRRMTGIELAEWCAKGKGLFKNTDKNMIYTYVSFDRDEQLNEPVGEWILIRGWDDPDWRDALVEE